MDKTHNISLGGFSFVIENKAYQELSNYLNDVRKSLGNNPETEEIIYDVEQRMAELLKKQMQGREVIVSQDVQYLIAVLGTPEQYTLDEEPVQPSEPSKKTENQFERISAHLKQRKLYRDIDRKKLGGVLAGLSHYLNFDVTGLRIIYLALLLLVPSSSFVFNFPYHFNHTFVGVGGFWIVMYFVFWVLVPAAKTVSEKIEMQGKSVTIDTLSASKNLEEIHKTQFYRSRENRKLGGVLGGVSEYFSVQSTWVRIIFIIALLGFIPFLNITLFLIIAYLAVWIITPEKPIFLSEKQENQSWKDKNTSNKSNLYDEKTQNTSDIKDFSDEKMQNSSDVNNFYSEKAENTDEETYESNSHQNFQEENKSFAFVKPKNQGFWGFIRAILKGILYTIIGFCILILGAVLISIILALFGLGMGGWAAGFTLLAMTDYLPFVVGGDWQVLLTYVSVFSLLVLPISVICILCLKLFSKKAYNTPKVWILFNVFLFFFGVIGGFIVVVDTIKHFRTNSFVEETIHFPSKDTISLAYQSSYYRNSYENNLIDLNGAILKDDNEFISKGDAVLFFVKETTEKEPYIVLTKKARGRNFSEAKKVAKQIEYNLKVEDSKITLPELYSFGKNAKIREQKVRIYLYLPQGKYITSSSEKFSVIGLKNEGWVNIGNNTVAQMTENGFLKIEKDSLQK